MQLSNSVFQTYSY